MPGQIVNGDLEQGPGVGWNSHSLAGRPVIVDGESLSGIGVVPHSGSWAAWLGGVGGELAYVEQRVSVSQTVPSLGFWLWIESEDNCGGDVGLVLVGAEQVASFALCAGTQSAGWQQHSLDLSAYAGQTVWLRFQVVTDASQPSSLLLDDVGFGDGGTGGPYQIWLPLLLNGRVPPGERGLAHKAAHLRRLVQHKTIKR